MYKNECFFISCYTCVQDASREARILSFYPQKQPFLTKIEKH